MDTEDDTEDDDDEEDGDYIGKNGNKDKDNNSLGNSKEIAKDGNLIGKNGNKEKDNNALGNSKEIAKLEHEIKSLCANLESDLVILQRMTSSPNRNNPYAKFDELSVWKKNNVDHKVAVLKAKIDNLKESATSKGYHHKGNNGKTDMTAL